MSRYINSASNVPGEQKPHASQSPAALFFYVGTYEENPAASICLCRMDTESGHMEIVNRLAGGAKPSFLALHPDGRFLYAVSELSVFQGQPTGGIAAFAIEATTGHLALLNSQSSHGVAPCHLVIDRHETHVLTANYHSGTLAVYPIGADGCLQAATDRVQHRGKGPDPERQEGPHAHSINLSPDNRFALACDLGLDQVLVYRFDPAAGRLLRHKEAPLSPGAGPRHLCFHPNGPWAYVINELHSSVTVFAWDAAAGALEEIHTVTSLPAGYTGFHGAAEVAVHPSGRFVYASNRGPDTIAIFEADEATGRLALLGHEPTRGKWPRHFALDPIGTFLLAANQHSDSVTSFRINPQTGALTMLHQIDVPKPVCVKFRSPENK